MKSIIANKTTAPIIKSVLVPILLPARIAREKTLEPPLLRGGNEFGFMKLTIIYILKEIKIIFKRIQYKDCVVIIYKNVI
jgi:hypothetical protein